MVRRAVDPQRQRLLKHLIVPQRLVVGMQQDMCVGVDQAWQQGCPGQFDRASILRDLRPFRWPALQSRFFPG